MAQFASKYVSKQPDSNGLIAYTSQEHDTWRVLFERMMTLVPNYACDEFNEGLQKLNITAEHIPQLPDINQRLQHITGWGVEPVPALIPIDEFFELLVNKRFPAATFIRIPEELDYVQEPDIFHELFGHCPLLTNQAFADFTQAYGKLALSMNDEDRVLMQRLYWFTVEFGLIKTAGSIKSYGGGILSSFSETQYAVDSDQARRYPLADGVEALRTPYRIDILQPVYFYLDSFEQLYSIIKNNPEVMLSKARKLGEHTPFFSVDEDDPAIHIYAC